MLWSSATVRKSVVLVLACFCAFFGSVASARLVVPTYDELPVLAPLDRHMTACSRIGGYFTRQHYKIVNIDDAFADKVIDRFLSFLDYGRSLYTQSEVDSIYNNKDRILSALSKCDLRYPYYLYNDSLRKRYKKYSYFLEILKGNIDVSTNEGIAIDRSKSPFASSAAELQKIWSAEIKNDYINQILNDKTDKEAKQRLQRRYEAALSRLGQTESEDAFSVFENSFATAIDPHTNYLGPEASDNFNDDINLSLEGIGAVLTQEDEFTKINSLLPGSPAEKSKKLKAGDRIIGVRQQDGTYDDIIGWRLTEVVKKIKGPKGSEVTLEIERGEGANAKSFNVTLARDKIRLQDREAKGEVKTAVDGSKIGVLTISSFYSDLHLDVERELNKLSKKGVKAIVIDLRNNGGGLLPEAVSTTGLFINKGPVVLVRDVQGNEAPYEDMDESISYRGPLVVLINRLSASSSEIMAAALRDYGRAIVVGDTSFGKGTVQQNRPLNRLYDLAADDMGSIHYTIAKFYRINGGSTQLRGVSPDIKMPTLVDDKEFGERSEPNALGWDKISPTIYDQYLNLDAFIPSLRSNYDKRTKNNVEFKILKNEMDRYLKLKASNFITVNLQERKQIAENEEKIKLEEVNTRLKLMGKPQIAKLKDLPEDFEFDDPILNETVNIASDFAKQLGQAIPVSPKEKSSLSIFQRFSPPQNKTTNL